MTSIDHTAKPEVELGRTVETVASVPRSKCTVVINVKKDTEVCKAINGITSVRSVCSEINGPVRISGMQIRWMPKAKDAELSYVAFTSAASVDLTTYDDYPNAGGEVSNQMTYGKWNIFPIVIPAGLASQIYPVSGDFPSTSLFIYSKGESRCKLDISLEIHGDRIVKASDF